MRLADGCRLLIALVLLGCTTAAASCASSAPGPVLPYEAAIGPDAPRRFILFGDSRRKLSEEFWRQSYDTERLAVIRALADEAPAFIVNTGDLVTAGSDSAEWRHFHEENQPIFSKKIPYFPALGNHEYMWNRREGTANTFAAFPQMKGRKWYDIRFPPVLLLLLDSNFPQLDEAEIDAQDRWLAESLAAAEKEDALRHVILICHHAPYTNAVSHGDSLDVQRHFLKRLTPKAHIVLTGHVHSYERFLVDNVQYVVSGGGGAPLFQLDVERPRHKGDLFPTREAYRPAHYCRFTIDGPRLRCEVIMLQNGAWKTADTFECR
jgi:3',5'-cyclic AMP phosphodiesterase CpdA